MIHQPEIWEIILTYIPRGCWVSLRKVYQIVERHGSLDAEDFNPQSPISDIPKWKRNVRNVLRYRKGTRKIQWDGDAKYLLP